MNFDEILKKLTELAVTYSPRILGALLVAIIGFWLINMVSRAFGQIMSRQKMDASLTPFLKSLVSVLLKVLLVISIFGLLGIEMTSFIAILGAAGLAVGMALSGTLQNFAGGVMILMFKPFKVGDLVEAQGFKGIVTEIQVFTTTITSPAGRRNIVANATLANGSVTNFTNNGQVCIDFTFGIGYGESVKKARAVIQGLIDKDERILRGEAAEGEPLIVVSKLDDSSVNFTVLVWCTPDTYWGIFFDMHESVYDAFNEAGIGIPYPQMDVHVHNSK